MARLLSRIEATPSSSRFLPSRALSAKGKFPEIDPSDEPSSSSTSDESGEGGGVSPSSPTSSRPGAGGGAGRSAAQMRTRLLDGALHAVLARRAAPDWLPFVPGASYWVPPTPRPLGVATNRRAGRGWASPAYFWGGKKLHPVKRSRKDANRTDDEES